MTAADVISVNKNFGPNRASDCNTDGITGLRVETNETCENTSCASCCNGNHCDMYEACAPDNYIEGCNVSQWYIDNCFYSGGDVYSFDCQCHWGGPGSPILIDVLGDGFNLTDVPNGVNFDLNGDGECHQLAWTSAGTDDAFLALDRNGNGTIDDGKELFGNFTHQPRPPVGISRNGFNALAVYDKPRKGGNSDGIIDIHDSIFPSLSLWQDANHNGISESVELHSLPALGLKSIDLDYKKSRRTDQYGNEFKYRAKVKDTHDAQLGRWAWDVFFVGGL